MPAARRGCPPRFSARAQFMLPPAGAPPLAACFNGAVVLAPGHRQQPAWSRTRIRKPRDGHSFLGSIDQIETVQQRLIRTATSTLAVEVDDEH